MKSRSKTSLIVFGITGVLLTGTRIADGEPREPAQTGGVRVLFIGNSLTYLNDLPGTLASMARSVGDTLHVETVAQPDFALIDHYRGSKALEAIGRGRWTYVVLQQGPSTTSINRDSLILTSQLFDTHIRKVGATPALYMVWPSRDRMSFFDAARISYQMAAAAVNGVFIPAGRAWATAWETDPSLAFYDPDGLHSSPLGTYLAALVIYERITGNDARLLPSVAVVEGRTLKTPEATIRLLQRAAHETNAMFPP